MADVHTCVAPDGSEEDVSGVLGALAECDPTLLSSGIREVGLSDHHGHLQAFETIQRQAGRCDMQLVDLNPSALFHDTRVVISEICSEVHVNHAVTGQPIRSRVSMVFPMTTPPG